MNLIAYKKIYVYMYVYPYASLYQYSSITFPKARILQDAPDGRTKRRREPVQQTVFGMAVVWGGDSSGKTHESCYKQHCQSEFQIKQLHMLPS